MSNGSASVAIRVSPWPIDWVKALLSASLVGLLIYAFWFQLVESQMTAYSWLVGHWSNVSNYSHGPLIPMIASFLLYWNVSQHAPANTDWKPYWRAMIAGVATLSIWVVGSSINKNWEVTTYYWAMRLLPIPLAWQVWTLREYFRGQEPPAYRFGLICVTVSMVLYYVGIKADQPRIVVIGAVLLLLGLSLTFCGRDGVRLLFFPICFLLLMVPLNFLDNAVGFPLRMFVAKAATGTLNLIGIPAVQRGSGIISRVFRFDVADPCSGIRSLMALTTVTAAYAYLTQRVFWKRWFLFLTAMPLAVLGNLARVVSIALVAQIYGQEVATKVYHDWSGFILFPVALGAMVVIGILLNFDFHGFWVHWLQPPQSREKHE